MEFMELRRPNLCFFGVGESRFRVYGVEGLTTPPLQPVSLCLSWKEAAITDILALQIPKRQKKQNSKTQNPKLQFDGP